MNEYPNAPVAWEVEDGDGQIGVENPASLIEVGQAILNMWTSEQFLKFVQDAHYGEGIAWEEWDFSDPGEVGTWVTEDVVDFDNAAWHIPTDIYESGDEQAWVLGADSIIENQPWHAEAPKGYTRVVWVQL